MKERHVVPVNKMKFVFLAIFAIATTVHLYASAKQNKKLRNITKPFLLAALLGFYLFAAESVSVFVVLALVFSWLGDVLLMLPGVKWFAAGGVSFMVSHAFFIVSYFDKIDFALINPVIIVLLGAAFAAAVAVIFKKLKPYLMKALFYPMFFYLLVNGAMNCFALFRMLSAPSAATIITCIGAFLFFISDSTLFFVRFKKDGRLKTHFWVMLTYSIGELLIISGLI